MATTANDVTYKSPAYTEMEFRWTFVRLVRNINESIRQEVGSGVSIGTGHISSNGSLLPRADAEGMNSYRTRIGLTFGFNALDETIHALTGLATRHDPDLGDDVPARIVDECEDIDLQGTHLAVFVQHCIDAALQDGHAGILVDHPKAPPGLTLEQEKALGLRAYFVLVPIERITAWRTGRIGGRMVITMVKFHEPTERDDGTFGVKTVERYRTMTQRLAKGHPTRKDGDPYVTYRVDEEQASDAGKSYITVDEGELVGPSWIPFHPFYGGERTGILRSMPPLRGLAFSNLEHTQIRSQRAYSMYKTSIAFPIWIGRTGAGKEGDTIVVSSDTGMDIDVGGDAKYMEGAGNALAPLRETEQDIEKRMGSQGYSMLRSENTQQKTLGEKQMQAAREESKLSRCVRSVKDAVEAAFGSMAAFYGITTGGGSVEMQTTFDDTFLTADEMRFLNELEDGGKLTLPTLLRQLQAGGRILQGVDIDEEVQAVELQQASEPMVGTIAPQMGANVTPPGAPAGPNVTQQGATGDTQQMAA